MDRSAPSLAVEVEHRRGDLFTALDLPALAHGCNCAGAMGAGIAVEFKRRWPAMYAEYRKRCMTGEFEPGSVFPWQSESWLIYNLGTQKTWRTGAKLDFIESAVRNMLDDAADRKVDSVGMPRIGAGLGGLTWNAVEARLRNFTSTRRVKLIVFTPSDSPANEAAD